MDSSVIFSPSLCGLYGMVKWGTRKLLGTHSRARYANGMLFVPGIGRVCRSQASSLDSFLSFFMFFPVVRFPNKH